MIVAYYVEILFYLTIPITLLSTLRVTTGTAAVASTRICRDAFRWMYCS